MRGPITKPLAAIKGRNPDPSQRVPDRFRLPPRTLAERLDERVGIESIERNGERAGIEVRGQALFLVGFDAGSNGVVELTAEPRRGFLQCLVGAAASSSQCCAFLPVHLGACFDDPRP